MQTACRPLQGDLSSRHSAATYEGLSVGVVPTRWPGQAKTPRQAMSAPKWGGSREPPHPSLSPWQGASYRITLGRMGCGTRSLQNGRRLCVRSNGHPCAFLPRWKGNSFSQTGAVFRQGILASVWLGGRSSLRVVQVTTMASPRLMGVISNL